jgi:hypothetical protein
MVFCKRTPNGVQVLKRGEVTDKRWREVDVFARCLRYGSAYRTRGEEWLSSPPGVATLCEFVRSTVTTWETEGILDTTPLREWSEGGAERTVIELDCSFDYKKTSSRCVNWCALKQHERLCELYHPQDQGQRYEKLARALRRVACGKQDAHHDLEIRIRHPHLLGALEAAWFCRAVTSEIPFHVRLAKIRIPRSDRNSPPGVLGAPLLRRTDAWPHFSLWYHPDALQQLVADGRVIFCPDGESEFAQSHSALYAEIEKTRAIYNMPGVSTVWMFGDKQTRRSLRTDCAYYIDMPVGRRNVCVVCDRYASLVQILQAIQTIVADCGDRKVIVVVNKFELKRKLE